MAGHELSRRSQAVGQCIFLESLRMGTVGPPEAVSWKAGASSPAAKDSSPFNSKNT